MGEEHDDVPGLPLWVETYFAEQRRYWAALREGGAVDEDDTVEMIRRGEW